MKNIVILISGGGSNMRALVEHAERKSWLHLNLARISVISNKNDAEGLFFAQSKGISTQVVSHQNYDSRELFEASLIQAIDAYQPDVVLLAGFMRILTPDFIDHYERRMFNIHPSLLPSFKGLRTHEAALAAGVKVHGATVHGVTAELDHGPIVMQSCVPVESTDTIDELAARVLKVEHQIYPQVLDWFVNERLIWDEQGIKILDDAHGVPAVQLLM